MVMLENILFIIGVLAQISFVYFWISERRRTALYCLLATVVIAIIIVVMTHFYPEIDSDHGVNPVSQENIQV